MSAPRCDWEDALKTILKSNSVYDSHAYLFVSKAVNYTVEKYTRKKGKRKSPGHHVTGEELIHGFLELLISDYSVFAPDVLLYWNVNTGHDIGIIVYNMIEAGVLSAAPDDRLEDFDAVDNLYDLCSEIVRRSYGLSASGIPSGLLPVLDE